MEKKRNEEIKQQQDNQQPVTVFVLLGLVRELVREERKDKNVGKMGVNEMMVKSLLTGCWRDDRENSKEVQKCQRGRSLWTNK